MKIKVAQFFIAITILIPVYSYSQSKFDSIKIRKEILAWFKDFPIANNDSLIDYLSFPSFDYKKLRKIKTNELYELTNHPLASVRIFASEHLTRRYPSLAFNILQNHLGDTTEWFCLPVEDGCASMTFLDYQLTQCSYSKLGDKEIESIKQLKQARLSSRRQFQLFKIYKKLGISKSS